MKRIATLVSFLAACQTPPSIVGTVAVGGACAANADCQSSVCDPTSHCSASGIAGIAITGVEGDGGGGKVHSQIVVHGSGFDSTAVVRLIVASAGYATDLVAIPAADAAT